LSARQEGAPLFSTSRYFFHALSVVDTNMLVGCHSA